MSSLSSRLTTIVTAGVLALGAVHSHRAEAGAGLKFCVDKASPLAVSGRALARAAAKAEGYEAIIVPFDGNGHGDDPFDFDRFKDLAEKRCDLVLGFPVDAADPSIPEGVTTTPAYARTGFVLVTRDQPPASLDDFPKGTTVSLVWSTVPNLYVLKRPNLSSDVYPLTAPALDALASGEDDAAMVWQPAMAAYLQTHPQAQHWHVRLMHQPHARWDVVALYAPASADAARTFEKGVHDLAAQGGLKKILQPMQPATTDRSSQTRESDRPGDVVLSPTDHMNAHAVRVADQTDPSGETGSGAKTLFTRKQATQGGGVYAKNCAQCHGANLEGMVGPTLKGPGFATKDMGFTVGAMFGFMAQQMPAGLPGSLTHEQYADVMAYLLQKNGYSAGDTTLTYDAAQNSKVPLYYRKQSGG